MAGRKFQHLPLRERSQLDQVLCVLYLLEDIFYLVLLCTIFDLLFALNRTNPRRNKIVHSLMSVILNQVLLSFFL